HSSEEISELIVFYNKDKSEKIVLPLTERSDRSGSGEIRITGFQLLDKDNSRINSAISGEYIKIKIFYEVKYNQEEVDVGISFWSQSEDCKIAIWTSYTNAQFIKIEKNGAFVIHFENFPLSRGIYYINIVV